MWEKPKIVPISLLYSYQGPLTAVLTPRVIQKHKLLIFSFFLLLWWWCLGLVWAAVASVGFAGFLSAINPRAVARFWPGPARVARRNGPDRTGP